MLDEEWYLHFVFNNDYIAPDIWYDNDINIDDDEITKYESLEQCKYNDTMHYLDDDFIDIDLKPDDLDWFNEFG